jgi:hypothetical protein
MNVNEKAIRDGVAKFQVILHERKIAALMRLGEEFLMDASVEKEYTSLTGNTLTSLAFGVYDNFRLIEVVYFDADKQAQRRKFTKGDTVYNYRDYEGNLRDKFTATIETDEGWGNSTSVRFLRSFKPSYSTSIVVTTGTEYSEFLENEQKLNVLTETEQYAHYNTLSMFRNYFKKIK